jgi:HEAT repeat protein
MKSASRLAGAVLCSSFFLPALPGHPARPALSVHALAQVPFEQAARDLASPDAATRLRAVQLLKEAAYPEAAIPLAPLITDADDGVQLEAIAAELNIFLAEPVVPRKRVALVVEVRHSVVAESAFSAGPLAIGALTVPPEVLTALRTAARDENPRVALESLYAFGVVAVDAAGPVRQELLRVSGPEIATLTGASDRALRQAAVRVLGRVFARRAEDGPVEPTVGDAVITSLNDNDRAVKRSAMDALGAMRYDRGVQALTDLFHYYGKSDAADIALDALARIAHPASGPIFAAELTGRSAARRGSAIAGLARLGDASRLPGIQAAIGSQRDEPLALAVAFASTLLARDPIDPLVEALTKPALRDQAKRYLIELAPGRSTAFSKHLLDPDERIRLDLVDAIALGGDPAGLRLVEPLMQDRDEQVARAAERAVARLKQAAARPVSDAARDSTSTQRTRRTPR